MKGGTLLNNETKKPKAVDNLDLALRVMDDDESALAEILTQFSECIIGLLVAKYDSFNREEAEDVLSIAVTKLWKRRNQYDEADGNLRSYLFKIADNTAKDVFKCGWAKARSLPIDFGADNDVHMIAEKMPPDNETKRQRKDREKRNAKELFDLKAIIDGLPDKERSVILSDVHAKDRVSEAGKLADELGIAVGSVRGYRSRAWKTIRTKMRELGYELPREGETHGK
jgi:RNA polymerase sigma factor (sigma-70 family)